MSAQNKPIILVSSSVYGSESLLNVIYAILEACGYIVWMSHKGTVPTDPALSNRDNCLQAVRECDLFLGIINGRYGSSITHEEIKEAVTINKPRWFLVHHNIVIARQLLAQYRFTKSKTKRTGFRYTGTPIMDDIRILEMYEDAMQTSIPFARRTGNWVQEYRDDDDIKRYIDSQFGDVTRMQNLLSGNTSAAAGTGNADTP